MKKVGIIFILGFGYGVMQWIMYYQAFIAPDALRALRDKPLEQVIHRMIEKQPFSLVTEEVKRAFPIEMPWMHNMGHWMGEAAYERYGFRAIGICNTLFNHGCYHGVVQHVARKHGLEVRYVHVLYDACVSETHDPGGCSDPIGHASMILTGNNISEALRLCGELYPDSQGASHCGIGVFMEFFNEFPHVLFRPGADQDALVHLCDAYPDMYRLSCVELSLSYIDNYFHYSMPQFVDFCHKFTEELIVERCFYALGGIAGDVYVNGGPDPAPLCGALGAYAESCMIGVLRAYQSTSQYWRATPLCPLFQSEKARQTCYLVEAGKADSL